MAFILQKHSFSAKFNRMDGFIYYSSLLGCVVFGSYYKKFDDIEVKRSYGSGLGILVACLICGLYVVYGLLLVWGNVIILKCCEKRYVHKISLLFTWSFLLFLHWNVECSRYVKWIMQTVSLRMVGLAFELHVPHKHRESTSGLSSASLKINDEDEREITINTAEVISYAFFFVGFHKGPYYRWTIFSDHFHTPFSGLGDCRLVTEQKIKKVILFTLGYWLLSMRYTEDVYSDNDFYRNYNSDYRLMYNIPILLKYFFEHQIVLLLCTAVCTETGFGVYPAKCHPAPGHGPTKQFSLLKLASGDTEIALKQDYNFGMLKCFDNQKLLMGPKMKDTMQGWDLSTRYWFWMYIYKDFVRSNKEVRSACSFLASTIFRGPSKQQVIMSLTLWAYVHLESDYATLYNTSGSMKSTWHFGYSIMRILCLIYLTPLLVISESATAIRYYNSIYWVFHIVLTILTLAALYLYKKKVVYDLPNTRGGKESTVNVTLTPVAPGPMHSLHRKKGGMDNTGTVKQRREPESPGPTHSATYKKQGMDNTGTVNQTGQSESPATTSASERHKKLPEDSPTTSGKAEKK